MPVVQWYHQVLGHCVIKRLCPGVHIVCERLRCGERQGNKQIGSGYGKLPPQHALFLPWKEVAVDLIGPWTLKVQETQARLNVLTCIDPVTNLVEMISMTLKICSR